LAKWYQYQKYLKCALKECGFLSKNKKKGSKKSKKKIHEKSWIATAVKRLFLLVCANMTRSYYGAVR
jgi:hypothetical protein